MAFFCSPILLFPLWFYFVWSYCDQLWQILHGMMSFNILIMWLLLKTLFSSALQTLISRFSPYHKLWTIGPLPFLSRNIFILWLAFTINTLLYTHYHDLKSRLLGCKSSWLLFQIFIINIFVIKNFMLWKLSLAVNFLFFLDCKVEFNQPSYWLYSMPNLLVF